MHNENIVGRMTACMKRVRIALLRMTLFSSSFRYSPICPKRSKVLNSETCFSLVLLTFEISL